MNQLNLIPWLAFTLCTVFLIPLHRATAQTQLLQVNDVSILFPKPKTPSDVDFLLKLNAPTSNGISKQLMPETMFDDVVNLGRGGIIKDASFAGARNFGNWRIVAFRFDPCFPKVTSSNCRLELRLVAQPIEVIGGSHIIVHDFALHLIYHPTQNAADIAKELLEMKRQSPLATDSFDLGEHPGLFRELQKPISDRQFTTRIKKFITSRMNDRDLSQLAFLGSNDGVTKWAFWLGQPDPSTGHARGLSIAANRFQLGTHQSFDLPQMSQQTFDSPLQDISDPFIRDNTTVPFFARRGGMQVPLEQTIQAAHRIENPSIHIQGSTDCVSCHTATTSRLAAQEMLIAQGGEFAAHPELLSDSSRFPHRFIGRSDLKTGRDQTINNAGMLSNLRMFGYFHSTVAVSQRTINESAAVAEFSNRVLLGQGQVPDKLKVFCPENTRFDKNLGFCVTASDALGPFTEAMTRKCEENQGGAPCRALLPFPVQGRVFQVQRWAIAFAKSIRGQGPCPLGAIQKPELENFCVESVIRNGKLIEEAYGPFSEKLVNRCVSSGGGDPCFFNRWSASFLAQLLAP